MKEGLHHQTGIWICASCKLKPKLTSVILTAISAGPQNRNQNQSETATAIEAEFQAQTFQITLSILSPIHIPPPAELWRRSYALDIAVLKTNKKW